MTERYFTYDEGAGHYTVTDSDDQRLGTITETEDGWRAYTPDGAELPGGEVYPSQHDAGAALQSYRDMGGSPEANT